MMMLLVRHNDQLAWWKPKTNSWESKDQLTQDELNLTVPESVHAVDAPFRSGGVAGIALAAAEKAYPGLVVEVFEKEDAPQEVEGEVS